MSSLACDAPFGRDGSVPSFGEGVDAIAELVGPMAAGSDGGSFGRGRCASIPAKVCVVGVFAEKSKAPSGCITSWCALSGADVVTAGSGLAGVSPMTAAVPVSTAANVTMTGR
jgi:hypothetical protein